MTTMWVMVDCLGVPFPKVDESAHRRTSSADYCSIAQSMIAPHHRFGHHVRMATYWRNEVDRRSLDRCAICDATAIGIADVACASRVDANTACASCGKTQVDSPFEGGDYFDVIMRIGRPMWRGARLRRAG
jgi:hypothetical protein